MVMVTGCTAQRLVVKLTAAPGGVETRTFTVRKNGTNQTLAVTITGAATTGSDFADTVAFSQFDELSVIHTRSTSPVASAATVSLQLV